MPHIAPQPAGVNTPPTPYYNDELTCREYLGAALGYCDGAVQTTDMDGRGFCTDHAKERGF